MAIWIGDIDKLIMIGRDDDTMIVLALKVGVSFYLELYFNQMRCMLDP